MASRIGASLAAAQEEREAFAGVLERQQAQLSGDPRHI
jgi:hypothetical protein